MTGVVDRMPQLRCLAHSWLGADLEDPTGDPWPAVDRAMMGLDADALFHEIQLLHAERGAARSRTWFAELGAHFHPALAGFGVHDDDDGVMDFLDALVLRYWHRGQLGSRVARVAAAAPTLHWQPDEFDVVGPTLLTASLGCAFREQFDNLAPADRAAFLRAVDQCIGDEGPVGVMVCTGLVEAIDNPLGPGARRDRIRAVMGPRTLAYLQALDG